MPELTQQQIDDIEKREGGRGLRVLLEDALAAEKKALQEVASLKGQQVIQDRGLSLVEPSDLAGVPVDEIEERAAQIQEEKLEAQRDLARTMFAKRGLEGADLDAAVQDFLEPAVSDVSGEHPDTGTIDTLRQAGNLPGSHGDPRQVTLDPNASPV